MIRTLVADDHPLIRSGVSHVLASERDLLVAGEASNSADVLRLLAKGICDILLLDISLPGKSGLEVLPEIRRRYPKLPILVLSVRADAQLALRALRAGATGFLTKSDAPSELVLAIRRIAAGRKYVSPLVSEGLAELASREQPEFPHEALSERELQVMQRIASGEAVSTVAKHMGLSVKTVSTYRSRALEKMKMRSNAEFMRYALRHGLVE